MLYNTYYIGKACLYCDLAYDDPSVPCVSNSLRKYHRYVVSVCDLPNVREALPDLRIYMHTLGNDKPTYLLNRELCYIQFSMIL